jgi:hypothetical protein
MEEGELPTDIKSYRQSAGSWSEYPPSNAGAAPGECRHTRGRNATTGPDTHYLGRIATANVNSLRQARKFPTL